MDSRTRTRYSKPVALVLLLAAWAAVSHVPSASALTTVLTLYLTESLQTLPNSSANILLFPYVFGPLNSLYGELIVFDDTITAQPDATSPEFGRARGSYLYVAKDTAGPGRLLTFTIQFGTNSGAPGSTLSFIGFDRTTDATRLISIVGGTGFFVNASGQAALSTVSTNAGTTVTKIISAFSYGS